MERYILARTSEAIKTNNPTQKDFLEILVTVEGIDVLNSSGRTAVAEYSGTLDELRKALGYSAEKVHIEKPAYRNK